MHSNMTSSTNMIVGTLIGLVLMAAIVALGAVTPSRKRKNAAAEALTPGQQAQAKLAQLDKQVSKSEKINGTPESKKEKPAKVKAVKAPKAEKVKKAKPVKVKKVPGKSLFSFLKREIKLVEPAAKAGEVKTAFSAVQPPAQVAATAVPAEAMPNFAVVSEAPGPLVDIISEAVQEQPPVVELLPVSDIPLDQVQPPVEAAAPGPEAEAVAPEVVPAAAPEVVAVQTKAKRRLFSFLEREKKEKAVKVKKEPKVKAEKAPKAPKAPKEPKAPKQQAAAAPAAAPAPAVSRAAEPKPAKPGLLSLLKRGGAASEDGKEVKIKAAPKVKEAPQTKPAKAAKVKKEKEAKTPKVKAIKEIQPVAVQAKPEAKKQDKPKKSLFGRKEAAPKAAPAKAAAPAAKSAMPAIPARTASSRPALKPSAPPPPAPLPTAAAEPPSGVTSPTAPPPSSDPPPPPEGQNQEGEKEKGAGSVFDLFTDDSGEDSEISKFAANFDNVSIESLLSDSQSILDRIIKK